MFPANGDAGAGMDSISMRTADADGEGGSCVKLNVRATLSIASLGLVTSLTSTSSTSTSAAGISKGKDRGRTAATSHGPARFALRWVRDRLWERRWNERGEPSSIFPYPMFPISFLPPILFFSFPFFRIHAHVLPYSLICLGDASSGNRAERERGRGDAESRKAG
ncbi:hypothetical protein B0H11DRAFT_759533 [Mycena galericulata]|nr:hypothetical protein B0H11DRAFT_759533 [Mycena galericulata]